MATDICYPDGTDWACYGTPEEVAALDPVIKERSEALAWSTLSALLGYRLALCPVVIRPCAAGCSTQTWDQAPVWGTDWNGIPSGGVFSPYISNGSWFNGCGCRDADSCGCTVICQIVMPSTVGDIAEISLDGAVLDPSAYRVDNGTRLVRTDGECWPVCQDMNLPNKGGYEPVVLTLPMATLTFTRESDIVNVHVARTGIGQYPAGTLAPWGSIITQAANPSGSTTVVFPDKTIIGDVTTGGDDYDFQYRTADTTPPVIDPTGVFTIKYYPNLAPNDLLRYAAGALAAEFYKACTNGKCRLPAGVTNITRNGITMEIPSGLFPNGATGLREVDPIIRIYNPNGVKVPPRVVSPDSARARVTTWSA